MERKGFKGFNEDMTNRYGEHFEEGKTYHVDKKIGFGNDQYGYHFCENIEDIFRYFDCSKGIKVARVTASGNMVEGRDEYYEYFDMYSAETIHIDHVMTREEIILEILNRTPLQACRFIRTGFKLSDEEDAMFRSRFHGKEGNIVDDYLDYYSRGDKEAFSRKLCKVNE